MKKLMAISIISLLVITNVLLNSCFLLPYPTQYKKYNTAKITLPEGLGEAFNSASIDQIEWYLATSKEWDFSQKSNNTMARKYTPVQSYEPYVAITVFTRGVFETGASYEPNKIIDLSTDTIDLDIYKPRNLNPVGKGSDRYYSSLTIKFSTEFFIRIDEHSYDVDRALTVEAINNLNKLFADKKSQEAELRENESISRKHESMEIVKNKYGTHDISGFVHLGKKNVCRIKIVDATTEEVYFEQLADDQSQFYVGWSSDINDCFSFFQRLTIKRKTNGPESADVKIQLWVDDDDGSWCALETEANLRFWVK